MSPNNLQHFIDQQTSLFVAIFANPFAVGFIRRFIMERGVLDGILWAMG